MSTASEQRAAEPFLDHFGILPRTPDQDLLWAIGEAFAHLPYENLTKLIRKHTTPTGACRRRLAGEVVADHLALGTGGTCFSLTNLFLAVLERVGYRCRPALCDMKAGPDTHCAVIIDLPEGPHLMDPGYLMHRPLPLHPQGESVRVTPVAEVRVTAEAQGFAVRTGGVLRYRLKTAAVSPAQFVARWEDSFTWGHLGNLHASRALETGYAYLHGHKLRVQRPDGKETLNVRADLDGALRDRFGIHPDVAAQARAIVARIQSGGAP
jgi:arylamine N-acetyltransferase